MFLGIKIFYKILIFFYFISGILYSTYCSVKASSLSYKEIKNEYLIVEHQKELDSLINILQTAKSLSEKTDILNLLSYKSSPKNAIEYARKALAIAKKTGYKKGIGNSLNYIGIAYHNMGDFEKALEYYFKALAIRKEINHKNGIAACYGNIGMIYHSLGNLKKSLEHYEYCMKIFEETGNTVAVANCFNSIANVHKDKKEYEQSLENYLKAIKIYEKINNIEFIAMVLNNLGEVNQEQGKIAEAINYTDSALILYRNAGKKLKIAYTLFRLGTLYSNIENYETAQNYLQKSLEIAKEIHAKNDIKNAYQSLYLLFEKQQDYKKALEYNLQYSQMKDSIFNEKKITILTEMQTKYETNKKEQQLLILMKDNQFKKITLYFSIGVFALILLIIFLSLKNYKHKQTAKDESIRIQIEKYLTEIENLRLNFQSAVSENSIPQKSKVSRDELNRYLLNPLSEREMEVLIMVYNGKTNKEIALLIFVSVNTVKTHIKKIYEKLNARNRTEAILKAGKLSILSSFNN